MDSDVANERPAVDASESSTEPESLRKRTRRLFSSIGSRRASTSLARSVPEASASNDDTSVPESSASSSSSIPTAQVSGSQDASATPPEGTPDVVPLDLSIAATTNVAMPHEDPPAYVDARRPTTPVTYVFSPLGGNAMTLLPPVDSADTRPLYNISVAMNVFVPTSYITTVRRGGSEDGPIVGDFEMGISNKASTVFIRDKECTVHEALQPKTFKSDVLTWTLTNKELLWDITGDTKLYTCFSVEKGVTGRVALARFLPNRSLRLPDARHRTQMLEVTPAGQEFMDDIVLSVLIIERRRRRPARHVDMFN